MLHARYPFGGTYTLTVNHGRAFLAVETLFRYLHTLALDLIE